MRLKTKRNFFLFLSVFLIPYFSFADTIKDNFSLLISRDQIKSKIKEVAKEINTRDKDEELVILMIMKGSVIFTSDLLRELEDPITLEYINCSSYGRGNKRGELFISGSDTLDLEGKNVLVVDDIFDSGNTLNSIKNILLRKKPKSLKTMVLLYKGDSKKVTSYRPDMYLFDIPDKFVVGYGLDYSENYRGLKDICIIENKNSKANK